MLAVRNSTWRVCKKSNIIKDYDARMSGIDKSNQMLSYYSALRKKVVRLTKALNIEIYKYNANLLSYAIKLR